jgi:hypothetical protein
MVLGKNNQVQKCLSIAGKYALAAAAAIENAL